MVQIQHAKIVLTGATWRVTVRDDPVDTPQGPKAPSPGRRSKRRKPGACREAAAPTVEHMNLPGFRLHPLKGEMKGFWAVTVRANWRVIFRFTEGNAEEVDYVDYH